jgi:GNAT superfamily N-acetyltransferase
LRGFAQAVQAKGPATLRAVTPEDAPQVAQLMTDYFYEARTHIPLVHRERYTLDDRYVRVWAKRAVTTPQIFGFIDDDGMIFGEIAETWVGPNRIARGGIWYVRPRARGGLLAWRLLKAFDMEAAKRGAFCSRMDLDNPIFFEVIDRMYKKLGYRVYSRIYVKEYD